MAKVRKHYASRLAFDLCPDWVRNHRCCRPWKSKGLRLFTKRINGWIETYVGMTYDGALALIANEDVELRERLFASWINCWDVAGPEKNPSSVAERMEKCSKKDQASSGNLVLDVVLASALRRMQKKAADVFKTLFRVMLEALARQQKWFPDSDEDKPAWWNDFFYYLTSHTGKDRSQAALNSYAGVAPLRFWLAITFKRFFLEWRKNHVSSVVVGGQSAARLDEDDDFIDARAKYSLSEEEYALILDCMKQALADLEPNDYLRLAWYYRDEMKNKDIAADLKESDYTTTRARQSALQELGKAFHKRAMDDPRLRDFFSEIGEIRDAGIHEFVASLSVVFDGKNDPEFDKSAQKKSTRNSKKREKVETELVEEKTKRLPKR